MGQTKHIFFAGCGLHVTSGQGEQKAEKHFGVKRRKRGQPPRPGSLDAKMDIARQGSTTKASGGG